MGGDGGGASRRTQREAGERDVVGPGSDHTDLASEVSSHGLGASALEEICSCSCLLLLVCSWDPGD